MRSFTPVVVVCLFLGGCASAYKTVPDGYSGSTAMIKDSFQATGSTQANFFYVEKVDGHDVENGREKSLAANRGKGFSMSPVLFWRTVPASKSVSLSIVGRTQHAAPILALTHAEFQVKGLIEFTPDPDGIYVVRGELGDSYSAVWLEEFQSKKLVSRKIEINGSAKLGIFEK